VGGRFYGAARRLEELAELISLTARALRSVVAALAEKQMSLRRMLRKARADLCAQGGNVRSMDVVDLGRAKALGLIGEAEAEKELARRRSAFAARPSGGLSSPAEPALAAS
jgi:hypothetical protein